MTTERTHRVQNNLLLKNNTRPKSSGVNIRGVTPVPSEMSATSQIRSTGVDGGGGDGVG